MDINVKFSIRRAVARIWRVKQNRSSRQEPAMVLVPQHQRPSRSFIPRAKATASGIQQMDKRRPNQERIKVLQQVAIRKQEDQDFYLCFDSFRH